MFQLAFHLGTINYMLTFVSKGGMQSAVSKYLEAKKDDPSAEIELSDDYAQRIGVRPADVKSWITIDRERESELMTQNKLHEIRTNLRMDQRIAGDSEIQMAAKSRAAQQLKPKNVGTA